MNRPRITNRYGVSYYVSPRRYRYYYRGLPDWEKQWHRYERRHPVDQHGFPKDEHAKRTISFGDTETLEAVATMIHDGKVGDPLSGIVIFNRLRGEEIDLYRIRTTHVDTSRVNPLVDPVAYLRLSFGTKRLSRLPPEQFERHYG